MGGNETLDLYAVRNQEGKYFRAKGFGGGGDNWVESLGNAELYSKLATARGRVSFFANRYPAYGTPEIIHLVATIVEVLDQEEWLSGVQAKARKREEGAEVRLRKRQLKEAEKALAAAQNRKEARQA